jgi:methylmalonyl-CoA/ethylmalonyl-CoA epimerase
MTLPLNHVAVVVDDLQQALAFWQTALGLALERTESNAEEQVDIAFFEVGGAHLELLQPTMPESGVGRYLAKRGAGLHHLCFEVSDLDATLERLRAQGIELINDSPKTRPEGTRYSFIHPKSTGGVLVELYEKAGPA